MIDLNGKTVLVTGGTGSFGQAFTKFVLAEYKPRRLVVFSRGEYPQYEMQRELDDPCLRYFIGDVRDAERLRRAFDGVDYVVHAAALKQVPACEYNPFEAIQTNVLGAQNVITAAIDANVRKVIALSSDKAANPINLYGATKLCSDKLFIAGNSYAGSRATRFSVVRYGNVLGSRGSVVPFFRDCRASGVVPVTDPRMTRFWIDLEFAVKFVLDSLNLMSGGEIYVPKLPSMRITELAEAIVPNCEMKITGIRAGEKIHEVMIPEEDSRNTLEARDHFVIQPQFEWWGGMHRHTETGVYKPVPKDFEYRSDMNDRWLSADELKALAEE